MMAAVFCDFFVFLAFVDFFDLSVEAIALLPFPPPPATAGVRVVTPNRPRMLTMAISLRISVLPVCPALLRMAFTPRGRRDARTILIVSAPARYYS
jgi:hypothetical protein